MPTALQHEFTVPGMVLKFALTSREMQVFATKFAGVKGESRINGLTAGRTLDIPVIVYGDQFSTQAQLSQWFEDLKDRQGNTATLTITSDVNRPPFPDCTFDGAIMVSEPLLDEAGSLGGGAWSIIRFLFRQHT